MIPHLTFGIVNGWNRSTNGSRGYESGISSEPGERTRERNGETGTGIVCRGGCVRDRIRCAGHSGEGWIARDDAGRVAMVVAGMVAFMMASRVAGRVARDGASRGKDGEREEERSEKRVEERHV